jgi:hypothetical protein
MPTIIAASPCEKQEKVLNRVKRSNERRFEKNYRFLSSDSLKARLSFDEAKLINYYYQTQDKNHFIQSVLKILKSLPPTDHSGAGGYISDDDYKTVAEGIWEKYSLFHEILLKLNEEGRINGITFVRLHSGGYYEDKYTALETGGIYD